MKNKQQTILQVQLPTCKVGEAHTTSVQPVAGNVDLDSSNLQHNETSTPQLTQDKIKTSENTDKVTGTASFR